MRKVIIALLLAGALSVSVKAQSVPPASAYRTITESWTAPISWTGAGSSVPCSVTVTTYCVSSYTETLTPPPGVTGSNVVTVAATATTNDWTPGGALYCGTWGISVIANWLDGSGQAISSAPLTGTTLVACPFTASPATGLKGSVK